MGRRVGGQLHSNTFTPGSAQVLAGDRRLGRIGLVRTVALWLALIAAGGHNSGPLNTTVPSQRARPRGERKPASRCDVACAGHRGPGGVSRR
jgi:hypothetical protein